jgi:glutamate synthase domain-containing protein 2
MSFRSRWRKVNKRLTIKQVASARFGVTASYVANADELQMVQGKQANKQVALARFGVTASYVANADELQIKMAQGKQKIQLCGQR